MLPSDICLSICSVLYQSTVYIINIVDVVTLWHWKIKPSLQTRLTNAIFQRVLDPTRNLYSYLNQNKYETYSTPIIANLSSRSLQKCQLSQTNTKKQQEPTNVDKKKHLLPAPPAPESTGFVSIAGASASSAIRAIGRVNMAHTSPHVLSKQQAQCTCFFFLLSCSCLNEKGEPNTRAPLIFPSQYLPLAHTL